MTPETSKNNINRDRQAIVKLIELTQSDELIWSSNNRQFRTGVGGEQLLLAINFLPAFTTIENAYLVILQKETDEVKYRFRYSKGDAELEELIEELYKVVTHHKDFQRFFDSMLNNKPQSPQALKPVRYPMCDDQPAQIDCRITDCRYHQKAECVNVSPAITLNPNEHFVCWSKDEGDEE